MSEKMDTPYGAEIVPAATNRVHGADRSGLGERGWAEVDEELLGKPDDPDLNLPPLSDWPQPAQAMGAQRPAADGKGIPSSTDG